MVNNIHCAYCEKELDRLVFCNASHKVMFHRKIYKTSTVITRPVIRTVQEARKIVEQWNNKGLSKKEQASK